MAVLPRLGNGSAAENRGLVIFQIILYRIWQRVSEQADFV
jgi:hypothetical protein